MKFLKIITISLLLSAILLSGCSDKTENVVSKQLLSENVSSVITVEEKEVEFTDLGEIDIHNEYQKKYLADDIESVQNYAEGKAELSRPHVVRIEWDACTDADFRIYRVYVSKNEDFSDSYVDETIVPIFSLCNFEIGEKYYIKAAAVCGEKEKDCAKWKLSVRDVCPRVLSIPDVTNVRDLGGYKTEDGKKIRQGMIYRGARLNHSASSNGATLLTEKSTKIMHDFIKLKTEVDLRRPGTSEYSGIAECPVPDVNYINIPMLYAGGSFINENKKEVIELFDVLSNENNYPLYFHCAIGTDRTGFVAFVIGAICGMSEEDLYRDYLFSNFGNIGGSRTKDSIYGRYVYEIISSQGDTLAEKAKNFLKNNGVEEKKIDAVAKILKTE